MLRSATDSFRLNELYKSIPKYSLSTDGFEPNSRYKFDISFVFDVATETQIALCQGIDSVRRANKIVNKIRPRFKDCLSRRKTGGEIRGGLVHDLIKSRTLENDDNRGSSGNR